MDNQGKTVLQKHRPFGLQWLNNLLSRFHTKLSKTHKVVTLGCGMAIYLIAVLRFGPILKISSNYFVLFPVIAASFCCGLKGGFITGILALPANLILFALLGHPEFAPASKAIAQISGILVGTVLGYMSDYYYELEIEVNRRRRAEERLLQIIEEKELLLHEIHHRVKNNLNIVKSLIQLQLNRSDNEGFIEEGEKLIQRIYSISLVHEQLYRGREASHPYLVEYIPALVDNVLRGLEGGTLKVSYRMEAPGKTIETEQATPLGLILNEVLTNALKFGFPRVESPELTVVLREIPGKTIIELIDNAPPFIPSNDNIEGLGLKLIKTLSVQLGARYEFIPREGTIFRLTLSQ